MSSSNFLASNNLRSIRSLSGETDLEAPDWAITKWGSAFLLELQQPEAAGSKDSKAMTWHADVPLHLRYLPLLKEPDLSSGAGQRNHSVPWPSVFWACPSDEGTKMNTNPFDRVNLGYDGLFGPRTMFYHLQPSMSAESLAEGLAAPALDLSKAGCVETGTVAAIVMGFMWVCWQLLKVCRGHGEGPSFRRKNE